LSAGVFLLASGAVAVIAMQTAFFPEQTWIVTFEVVACWASLPCQV
jgi:hypothetical protein